MSFHKIVLVIALVVLTIAVLGITAVLSFKKGKDRWPPEIGTCPPYYKVHTEPNNEGTVVSSCVRPQGIDIGDSSESCNNFALLDDKGKPQSINAKREWAERCKIKWEGYN